MNRAVTALEIHYEGHVQGVGFRYQVKQIAKGFDVRGSVENLADGRVRLQVAGDDVEVRAFLEAIAESELRALIKKQTETTLAEPFAARGFEIRHG